MDAVCELWDAQLLSTLILGWIERMLHLQSCFEQRQIFEEYLQLSCV